MSRVPEFVRAWRHRLQVAALLQAVLVAGGAALVAYALLRRSGAEEAAVLAVAVGGLVAPLVWWQAGTHGLADTRVALWLEEQYPGLSYALVGRAEHDAVEDEVIPLPLVDASARRRVRRSIARAALVLAAGVAVVAVMSTPAVTDAPAGSVSRGREASEAPGTELAFMVAPPAYTRAAPERLAGVAVLRPLVGSRITAMGTGSEGPRVELDGRPVRAVPGDTSGWRAAFLVDTAPRVLRVTWPGVSRVVAVVPVRDAAPVVTLDLPAADTLVDVAPTAVPLAASARDDLGIASARFEYIVSSGEGERFTFRSGALGATGPSGREARITARLDLSPLTLAPGDVVHLRAVARDGRAGDEGLGSSESRVLRVRRVDGTDSVAVEAAPPPTVDAPLLSQRMLINLAEDLKRRAPRLSSGAVASEAARIGRDQARLRRQVSDLVFARLGDDPSGEHFHGDGHAHGDDLPSRRTLTPEEVLQAADRATGARGALLDVSHDETPVVATSRPLLEAYNAMWAAGRALESGEVHEALPHMYAALAAIQAARAAERLYLRGVSRPVVVDLSKVRLAARERGMSALLPARAAVAADDVLSRFMHALTMRVAGGAIDSLVVLRVAVAGHVGVAAQLDTLIADLGAGRDVTARAVVVARLMGGGVRRQDVGAWTVVP